MAASSNPASSTYNLPKLQSRSLSINMNFYHHNKRLLQAKMPSHRKNITTTNASYRQKRLLTGKASPQQTPFTGKNAFSQAKHHLQQTPFTGKNAFHRQNAYHRSKRLSQAKRPSQAKTPFTGKKSIRG
jgi:hypothetical protein